MVYKIEWSVNTRRRQDNWGKKMGKIFGCRHEEEKTLNSVVLIKSEEEGGEELEKRAKSVKCILNLLWM